MTTFGSVCSGIEAASVAWHPLGWRAAWLAEIEPFPCAVLAHHYPTVPNLGDMTALPERIRSGEIPAPDVFTGGTPCQAFSVAGKRESLADARGNLSLTFCEIANAIDDVRAASGDEPCVVLWENVPGVLSTADNAFGCFLGALAGADDALVAPGGRWADAGVVLGPRRAVAWRILDAQFFGLAQRRRRVFVVASARDGFDPGAVLLEFDGVRRDSAPRREAREETASGLAARAGGGGRPDGGDGRHSQLIALASGQSGAEVYADGSSPTLTCLHEAPIVAGTLTGALTKGGQAGQEPEHLIAHTLRGEGFDASEDGTGRGTPLVPVAFSCKDHGADAADDLAPTLRAMGSTDGRPNGGGQVAVAFAQNQRDEVRTMDVAGALAAEPGAKQQTYVAFHCDAQADQLPGPETDTSASASASLTCSQRAAVAFGLATSVTPKFAEELSPTLTIPSPSGGGQPAAMAKGMSVRRLTPRECERLQGFPDDYTLIPWRKKPAADCPDGPRYKALGNSWAVPCVRWIGARIDAQLRGGHGQ